MIGYCVQLNPALASYRLRVAIPAANMGRKYVIGATGSPTFFYKDGDPALARSLKTGVLYDVVNDHFTGPSAADYHAMCKVADVITVSSERMAEVVKKATGRESLVIDDPYENSPQAPKVKGELVLWFGHAANLSSMRPYADLPNLKVCSNVNGALPWSLHKEAQALDQCAVVLLTGNNVGASTNRIAKSIMAGRFVVTPGGVPSWEQFKDFCWIGDVRQGIEWALNNREEACRMITRGQKYTQERFAPTSISARWTEAFDLTSERATKNSKAG